MVATREGVKCAPVVSQAVRSQWRASMTPTLAPLVIEEAEYDTDRGMQCDELGPQLIEM